MFSVSETPISGDPAREGPLELDGELPAARGGGLEQRVRVGRPQRARRRLPRAASRRPPFRTVSAARDGHDDVGLDERGVDAAAADARLADVDEVRALGVVHLDAAVEPSGELRVDEQLELAVAGPAGEARGDEQRLPLEGRAGAVELGHRRGDRGPARIVRRSGDRERRRLDDDRRPAAARDERLERLAGEREAERVANGSRDVGDRLAGRRRSEHDVVVRRLHDGEPRAVRQGQRASLGNRAVEPEERAAEPAPRPEARGEQVRLPPVGDHDRVARARAPTRSRRR